MIDSSNEFVIIDNEHDRVVKNVNVACGFVITSNDVHEFFTFSFFEKFLFDLIVMSRFLPDNTYTRDITHLISHALTPAIGPPALAARRPVPSLILEYKT